MSSIEKMLEAIVRTRMREACAKIMEQLEKREPNTSNPIVKDLYSEAKKNIIEQLREVCEK